MKNKSAITRLRRRINLLTQEVYTFPASIRNLRRRIAFFLCIFPCLCLGLDITGQQEQKIRLIMGELSECRFDSAESIVNKMIVSDSGDPLAWMLYMAEITLRQLDYSQTPDSDSFQMAFDRSKSSSAEYKKQNGVNSYILTIDAYSQFIAAAYAMHRKKYISGFKLGLEALSICKEVKKNDSGNVDVDFILGLYNYARAELNRKSLGIFFWYSGDKLSGIAAIEACSRSGRIFSQVADMALQEIYVKESLYEKAMQGTDRLLAAAPKNRFVLWTKAKLFDARKNSAGAALAYESLADAYETIPDAKENYFQTRLLSAKRFDEIGNFGKVVESCNRLHLLCRGKDNQYCREGEALASKIRNKKD